MSWFGFSSSSPSSSAQKDDTVNPVVKEAVASGKQVFLHDEVVNKVKEVREIIESFNKDDSEGLMSYVERYNADLKKAGQSGIDIPDSVKKSLLSFHNAVLSNLEGASTMTPEERKAALIKRIGEGNTATRTKNVFELLGKQYAQEMEDSKKKIIESTALKDNKEMQGAVTDIMNSMKSLKIKYKYFEYKYIEMNLFLILFIQKVYQTMDQFINNVLAFNKMRDASREALMQETLNVMVNIITSANLELNPEDFDQVTKMMDSVTKEIGAKEEQLKGKLNEIVALTSEDLSSFIDSLTETTQKQLVSTLSSKGVRATPAPAPVSTSTSAYPTVSASTAPRAPAFPTAAPASRPSAPLSDVLFGGFLRDGSMLPQPFYELDKSS